MRGGKFKVAAEDAFDRSTVIPAAVFIGEAQCTNAIAGSCKAALVSAGISARHSSLVIGDYMTERVFSMLLHQDQRYYRQGTGSIWCRLDYAMGQIFWTHRDSGGTQFDHSRVWATRRGCNLKSQSQTVTIRNGVGLLQRPLM
jgi:hypothetical protein